LHWCGAAAAAAALGVSSKRLRQGAAEMFYSKALLSKKGPLGTVWVTAFCAEAALTRDQVARTDIVASVGNDSVSTPAMREQSPFGVHSLL